MIWLRLFIHRLCGLFLKQKMERDLEDEIRSHLDMQIEDNLRLGMSPEEARYEALRKFGGVEQVKESYRDRSSLSFVDSTLQDLGYGLRMLWKDKGFTAIALLSLALGIGANTAIFSLVDTVLIKTLPVKNPEQLVFLERGDVPPGPQRSLSRAFFEQARAHREALAGVCAFATDSRVNVVLDGQAEIAKAQRVSGSFFAVLGVNTLLGRTITDEDDKVPGAHPVVVISYRYWRRRFASDQAIVGKTILLNGHPFTIIGVTPPEFFGAAVGEAPDLWGPWMMSEQISLGYTFKGNFNNPVNPMLARLKPEVSEQQARTLLTGLLRQTALEEIGIEIELWSPERQQAFRQQNIALIPASRGFGGFGKFAHAVFRTAAHPNGSRGFDPADCLRQCSQFVDGARNRASERNCRASRARSQSLPAHPPIAHRRPVARWLGRRVGIGFGVVEQPLFIGAGGGRAQSGFSKRNAGRARARVYRGGFGVGGHPVRPCACVARDGRRFDAGAQR